MTDPIKTETVDVPMVPVTIISSSLNAPITGTVAETPDHLPNLVVTLVSPLRAISIRFANSYLTTLVGLLTVSVTTTALPAPDFFHKVSLCASLALAGPVVALGKDFITVLGKLEQKYPLLTGSV